MKVMRWDVTIAEVENGYVARVGCKLFVFSSWEKLSKELEAYAKGGNTELSERIKEEMGQQPETTCEPPVGAGARQNLTDNLARS